MMATKPQEGIPVTNATSDEKQANIEQRLAMLGESPSVGAAVPTLAPAPAVGTKSNKNALLARIMAAQERAKQAQMKQASQEDQPSEKLMMKALDGFTGETPKPMQEQQRLPVMASQTSSAADMVKTTPTPAPPAPSLEMFEMNMQQKPMAPPPAPVVDNVSLDIFENPKQTVPAPAAPPAETPGVDLLGNFGGIMSPAPAAAPVVDIVTTTPAAEAETAALDEVYGCNLDGLALSPEEKQKMIEEQRAIMEQIAKESSNEKTSMAAIKADAFAARMTGSGPVMSNVDGFTASEVEEQRKILEQIEKEKLSTSTVSNAQGMSQMEQDRKLAESLQMSSEESRQMEEDRKLAERLQAEAYDDGDASEYPGNRRAAVAGAAAATAAAANAGEKSWWDTMNDAMVAVGLADPEAEEGPRSAEINSGGPPGSMSYSQRMMHNQGGEQEGLLGGGSGGGGRVAQSKPLFSCVVDSISSTANMITGADQEEVHGVDTTSFLTTPGENNASGSYYAVPEHD